MTLRALRPLAAAAALAAALAPAAAAHARELPPHNYRIDRYAAPDYYVQLEQFVVAERASSEDDGFDVVSPNFDFGFYVPQNAVRPEDHAIEYCADICEPNKLAISANGFITFFGNPQDFIEDGSDDPSDFIAPLYTDLDAPDDSEICGPRGGIL